MAEANICIWPRQSHQDMNMIFRLYDFNALDENQLKGPTTIAPCIYIRKSADGDVGPGFFPSSALWCRVEDESIICGFFVY